MSAVSWQLFEGITHMLISVSLPLVAAVIVVVCERFV